MRKVGLDNPFSVTEPPIKPATERQVARFEKRIGASLPEDYRQFLLTINGGSRPGLGWELPNLGISIHTFYGLCRDFHDLNDAVEPILQQDEWTEYLPSNSIPIACDLASDPFLLKYSGEDVGSIWYWDHELLHGEGIKIAENFDALVSMLHQAEEPLQRAALRMAMAQDDVDVIRQFVMSQPISHIDDTDPLTGHSLLQHAADVNATKVIAFLLKCGARGLVGLGSVNKRRHRKTIKLLLTSGVYQPTENDWWGAVAFGGIAILRVYFDVAPTPSPELIRQFIANRMRSKPSKERLRVISLLKERLASVTDKSDEHGRLDEPET